ncbi:hypothetical protein [Hoylesella shahii]|uniref:hypothetical protein n=1 Tax=Hoylesella shahii TaxID=228603 RepID=UPI0028EDC0E1|nr:hypothetical protein [Hoylesella shahii]
MEKKNVIESLSLNPCFNGRCTSTGTYKEGESKVIFVLILVLMEDALVRTIKVYHLAVMGKS